MFSEDTKTSAMKRRWILVVIAFVCLSPSMVFADISIVQDGIAQAVIAISPGADAVDQHAAEELSKFVEDMTGTGLAIVGADAPGAATNLILIGRQETNTLIADLVTAVKVDLSASSPGGDGFIVKTVDHNSLHYLVLGGSRGRGNLYAVYDFLEKECGVGFFWDGDQAPAKSTLFFSSIDRTEIPALVRRNYWNPTAWTYTTKYWSTSDWNNEFDWMCKRKLNTYEGVAFTHDLDVSRGTWHSAVTFAFVNANPQYDYIFSVWLGFLNYYVDPAEPYFREQVIAQTQSIKSAHGDYCTLWLEAPYPEQSPGNTFLEKRRIKLDWAQSYMLGIAHVDPDGFLYLSGWFLDVPTEWPAEMYLAFLDKTRIDNSLLAWGKNDNNQATAVSGNEFYDISCGKQHTLALKQDGSIMAWGPDSDPGYGGSGWVSNTPTVAGYRAVSAGAHHSVAIRKSDRSLEVWGSDTDGQISEMPAVGEFVKIAAGENHTVALTNDGTMAVWGHDNAGAAQGGDWMDVAARSDHSLALENNGTLTAWGSNSPGGQAGNDYMAVACGQNWNMALKQDGSIVAWGDNTQGQTNAPVDSGYVAIAAGAFHGYAMKADRSIVAWGLNDYGQVSNVPSGGGYVGISAGDSHGVTMVSTRDRVIVSNSWADRQDEPRYLTTNYFWGEGEWLFGVLNTFGCLHRLHGDVKQLIDRMQSASQNSTNLTGLYINPESVHHNFLLFDLATELAWDPQNVELEDYLSRYCVRRYGEGSAATMAAAWKLVTKSAYAFNSEGNPLPLYQTTLPFDPGGIDSFIEGKIARRIGLIPDLIDALELALTERVKSVTTGRAGGMRKAPKRGHVA
jgi:hypothetical protein